MKRIILTAAILGLSACGGGGGGSTGGGSVPTTPSTPVPTPTATATATSAPQAISGTVISIPQGAYNPAATSNGFVSGATIIIGSTPVLGATPPATAPSGDVSTTTNASGMFSVTPNVAAAAQTLPIIVLPVNNAFGATVPAKGYYVEVLPSGADGKTSGMALPLHAFLAAGSGLTLRITTASSDESSFLAQVNSDRASNAGETTPLILDELAVEAARQHAAEMSGNAGFNACHYSPQNEGPATRYALLGALGLDLENVAGYGDNIQNYNGAPIAEETNTQVWQNAESAWVSEKATNGSHYVNLTYAGAQWAGTAVVNHTAVTGTTYDHEADADLEIIAPGSTQAGTAPNENCPSNITANNS